MDDETEDRGSRAWVILGKVALALCIWGGIGCVLAAFYFLHDIPDASTLTRQEKHFGVRFLDADGKEAAYVSNNVGKRIDFYRLPAYLVDALVATEDRRFFDHIGVDFWGIMRASVANFRAGHVVQGGSTLTQQLAKLSFLTPEKTLRRKVQEMYLALYLEASMKKQDIMALYLSRVYFGNGNYGLQAASKDYFDKDYEDLSLFESAILIGLIKAPSVYNPYSNPKKSEERAMQVLYNMADNGSIPVEALSSPTFSLAGGHVSRAAKIDPEINYFVDWLSPQIKDYIGVPDGEYVVKTSLNRRVQHFAQRVCVDHTDAEMRAHRGLDLQCSVVMMTPNGEVLAMTGGRSYTESSYNRAFQAKRQPGSLFKLFVYISAMEHGMHPWDTVVDRPVSFRGWRPKNWNDRYVGPVTLENAFARSINSVAVQLAQRVGLETLAETAERLGISAAGVSHNPSMALGSEEVNLLDITSAYAHMANRGRTVWPRGVVSISDEAGRPVYQYSPAAGVQAVRHEIISRMTPLLRAVVTKGTGKRAGIPGGAVAGKTGTSTDARDAWFVGFTPDVVAGVWTGRDDNGPMPKGFGGGDVPAEMFHDLLLAYYEDKQLSVPDASLYDGMAPRPPVRVAPEEDAPEGGGHTTLTPRGGEGPAGFMNRLFDMLHGR